MSDDNAGNSRKRPTVGFTLNPARHLDLRALAQTFDLPASRFVETLVRERLATLTPEERASFEAARANIAAQQAA